MNLLNNSLVKKFYMWVGYRARWVTGGKTSL